MQKNNNRSPVISIFLNILAPGFGHLYLGFVQEWIFFSLLAFVIKISALWWASTLYGLVVGLLITLALYIFIIVDSIQKTKIATELPKSKLQQKKFLISLLIIYGFLNLSISRLYPLPKAFSLPSASMCPSLLDGDQFMIQKESEFSRGEVVVYLNPKDMATKYVKRIIGIPGDTVEVRNNQLIINGKNLIVNKIAAAPDFFASCGEKFIAAGAEAFAISLDDKKYTLLVDGSGFVSDFPEVKIPENSYFLIGDNWSNSYDSRFVGFIKKEDIVGKALYIHFSSHDGQIRWNRLGISLN